MSIFRILIPALFLFMLPAQAMTKTILVLGDSLSAAHGIELERGWVHLLRDRLKQIPPGDGQWRVVNASVSGETTAGGLARLPALLDRHKPELCIIGLGANDGLRGLSIEQMRLHLGRMIAECRKYGKILLLGMKLPPNYGRKYTEAFDRSFTAVAGQNNIPLVPFLLEGVAIEEKYIQADGLHPTAEAQAIILENIWPALVPLLEGSSRR